MFQTLINEIGIEETLLYGLKVAFIIGAWIFIAAVALRISKKGE